ncbi:UNVERIFIED_CONTAM: hypothetical protein NCL1_54314 [Trichonephila clavipes]
MVNFFKRTIAGATFKRRIVSGKTYKENYVFTNLVQRKPQCINYPVLEKFYIKEFKQLLNSYMITTRTLKALRRKNKLRILRKRTT